MNQLKRIFVAIELWCKECFRVLKDSGSLFLNIEISIVKKDYCLYRKEYQLYFQIIIGVYVIILFGITKPCSSIKYRFCNTCCLFFYWKK